MFGRRDYREVSLTELFRKLKWLKIKDTRAYHDTISLQSMLRCQTPMSISNKFNITYTHGHNTRQSLRRYRLNNQTTSTNTQRSNGFVCRAARLWMQLDNEITMTNPCRRIFKDYVRADIGGWERKDETEEFLWWHRENETFPNGTIESLLRQKSSLINQSIVEK